MRPPLIPCLAAALLAQACALREDGVARHRSGSASSVGAVSPAAAAERFRSRLDTREHLVLPDGTELDRPFLCFVDSDRTDFGGGTTDDLASFRSPCANDGKETPGRRERLEREYGFGASRIADCKGSLTEAFVHSSPLLQKLLLHKRLKAINLLLGSGVSGISDGVVVRKRKTDERPEYIYALALNAAVFDVDPTRGLETFLAYNEAFQSLRGGLDHRARTLVAGRRYERMPGGPSATITLLDESKGRSIRGPVGVILKILHHELGHFMLSLVDPPALAAEDAQGRTEYAWQATPIAAPYRTEQLQRDADAPGLFFTRKPSSRVNRSYTFESDEMNRLRDALCFARDKACGIGRHDPGDAGFVKDLLAICTGSGLLTAIATWRPDEAFCEWESALRLEAYVRSWKVHPAPERSDQSMDVIAEMKGFTRRADVVRYLEYRRRVLSDYLDAMDEPDERGFQPGGKGGAAAARRQSRSPERPSRRWPRAFGSAVTAGRRASRSR